VEDYNEGQKALIKVMTTRGVQGGEGDRKKRGLPTGSRVQGDYNLKPKKVNRKTLICSLPWKAIKEVERKVDAERGTSKGQRGKKDLLWGLKGRANEPESVGPGAVDVSYRQRQRGKGCLDRGVVKKGKETLTDTALRCAACSRRNRSDRKGAHASNGRGPREGPSGDGSEGEGADKRIKRLGVKGEGPVFCADAEPPERPGAQ